MSADTLQLTTLVKSLNRVGEDYTERMLLAKTPTAKSYNRGMSIAFKSAATVLSEILVENGFAVKDEGDLYPVELTQ